MGTYLDFGRPAYLSVSIYCVMTRWETELDSHLEHADTGLDTRSSGFSEKLARGIPPVILSPPFIATDFEVSVKSSDGLYFFDLTFPAKFRDLSAFRFVGPTIY